MMNQMPTQYQRSKSKKQSKSNKQSTKENAAKTIDSSIVVFHDHYPTKPTTNDAPSYFMGGTRQSNQQQIQMSRVNTKSASVSKNIDGAHTNFKRQNSLQGN